MSSILITGASKGIGRATAAELARRGHRVVATARDPSTLDDLDVDQRLLLDVTDQASVDAAVAQAGEMIPRDAISALDPFDLESSLRQTVFVFAGRVTTAAGVRVRAARRQFEDSGGPQRRLGTARCDAAPAERTLSGLKTHRSERSSDGHRNQRSPRQRLPDWAHQGVGGRDRGLLGNRS
jgi:short chain dehydrogenase